MTSQLPRISRRGLLRTIAPITFASLLPRYASPAVGSARRQIPLNTGWVFQDKDTVTVPHCVSRLSWLDWDPASWQNVWRYSRKFPTPADATRHRVFVEFDGVMTTASPSINGHALPVHRGGYLPFRHEITEHLSDRGNLLEVAVDSRWQPVPPDGSPKGPIAVDYLEPGGITRPVRLSIVPRIYIADVFAKPVSVLDSGRRVEVACAIDATDAPAKSLQIRTELIDAGRVVAAAQQPLNISQPGKTEISLTLAKLGNIALWDYAHPHLYTVVTTLLEDGKPLHDHRARIGFREARFEVDGFFFNGRRSMLFGLNRHEVYPYVGAAMPPRVTRRDAEILRRDFNCNIVRCSHYPQSEAFLDACDELGLMVWQETPGWGYMSDDHAWKEQVVQNVTDMILRDRNHASIVIWGVRVNESRNEPALYSRTTEIAHRLDGTRPASGSMTPGSQRTWKTDWHEDVYAFDDYHAAPDGTVGIQAPLPGVPYMLAETVGQFNYAKRKSFDAKYVRGGDIELLETQAVRHAQAHNRARAFPRFCGVIAWCAFDYASLVNCHRAVKTPGVADVFRIPKPGAAFYQTQISPSVRPMIVPGFYWDSEAAPSPRNRAPIFSNCDQLKIFLGGKLLVTLDPDWKNFPHLEYPPFFCDLPAATIHAELKIDGYVGGKLGLSRSFSADRKHDLFSIKADDRELTCDGSDATRLVFQVTDRYGTPRAADAGDVRFELAGPGVIVGDSPFHLSESGAVGAVWIKSLPDAAGEITVTATHSSMGKKTESIRVHS